MRVGEFLPESLRASPTETVVVVLAHPTGCEACDSYVRHLTSISDEFRVWDARLVLAGDHPAAPGVVIADRYGQIFYAFSVQRHEELPRAAVVAEALKFIGTLCPE